jgi:Mycothiol maleylpyruvate isomerase N-terminal domain
MADDPRAELADRIRAIRHRWRELVAEVGEDRMLLPGPMGEWTFKDLASHLTAWRRRTIGRLEATGRGEPPPPNPWPAALGDDEDDPINAWIHEQTKDDPLPAVLAEADAAYEAVLAATRALPLDAAAT